MTDIIIERYCFTLCYDVKAGVEQEFTMHDRCDAAFHPEVIRANVPEPGLVIVEELRIRNITIFEKPFDLYEFSVAIPGQVIDLPSANEATKFLVRGRYTGKKPKGWGYPWWKFWKRNPPFRIACSFLGKAA